MLVSIKNNWKSLSFIVILFTVLSFLAYSFISPQGMFSGLSKELKALEPSEEFAYRDLDGNIVRLKQFKGKPIIINAWASWMPFSQTELQLLNRVKDVHQDSIVILAINRMEDPVVVRSFLSTFGISNSILTLIDPTDNFYKAISGYAMPETVFYHRDGTLLTHKRGVLTESELNDYVDAIIKQD